MVRVRVPSQIAWSSRQNDSDGPFSSLVSALRFAERTRPPNVRSDPQGLRPHAIRSSARSFAVRIDVFGLWQSNFGLRQQVVLQQHRPTGYNLVSRIADQTSLDVICRFQQAVRPIGSLCRSVARRSSLHRRRPPSAGAVTDRVHACACDVRPSCDGVRPAV